MDLENFDDFRESSADASQAITQPREALNFLDALWYTPASRRARWMDLIGDYGGTETFLIDGDSLVQGVLDDPTLAIGREIDPASDRPDNSFQTLHAKFLVEKQLEEFIHRLGNFIIVFFQSNKHLTIRTGTSSFVTESRALARKILFHHLAQIQEIQVYVFSSPKDPDFSQFLSIHRPMFILANDGGPPSSDTSDHLISALLLQRHFLLQMTQHHLPFALLNGAEFRDSKILAFIYDPVSPGIPTDLEQDMRSAIGLVDLAHCTLDDALNHEAPLVPDSGNVSLKGWTLERLPSNFTSFNHLFLLHLLLLPHLPLQYRARHLAALDPNTESDLHTKYLPSVFHALAAVPEPCPDLDGRIFVDLLRFVIQHSYSDLEPLVPPFLVETFVELFGRQPSKCNVVDFQPRRSLPAPTTATRPVEPYRLHSFSHRIFDAAFADVNMTVKKARRSGKTKSVFGLDTLGQDTKHWHSSNAILPSWLGGQPREALTPREKKWKLKREQRELNRLQKQAESLTGASGNVLVRITIPPPGSSNGIKPTKARQHYSGSSKSKKLSNKEVLQAKITQQKQQKLETEDLDWWAGQIAIIKKKSTTKEQLEMLRSLKSRSRRANSSTQVTAEIRVLELDLVARDWVRHSSHADVSASRDIIVVYVLRHVQELSSLNVEVSVDAHKWLQDLIDCIGFGDYSSSLLPSTSTTLPRLTFKLLKLISKNQPVYPSMRIEIDPIEWQLHHFGEFMDRSMDGAPDDRVTFLPDKWQRDVLDCIDRNQSVLVLAPTSAGKTFISFYAMEKILRQSDTDVLVYVAPTKALVNQIAAEVYGRFSKAYHGNRTLLAIITRDTRFGDIQRAQILITVPEMLSILMLSPTLAKNWTSNIKRIILDEIHSIGQENGGAVWEQIILLAPCPVIGLSATVGEPEKFNEWLTLVQDAHNFHHVNIHHPHRYSHLRKSLFISSGQTPEFRGLSKHLNSKRLTFLHPISLLSEHATALPSDLALEARDCATLFYKLRSTNILKDDNLQPANFFASSGECRSLLKQRDILAYEASLKRTIQNLLDINNVECIQTLTRSLCETSLDSDDMNKIPSKAHFLDDLMTLVCDLHELDHLPAILFNFDRSDCMMMASALTRLLQKAEKDWKDNSSEWMSRLTSVEEWRKAERFRKAQREKEKKRKIDQDEQTESQNMPWQAMFDENEPLPDFSFAGRPPTFSKAGFKDLVSDLKKPWVNTPEWAINALERGIAVHHAGMPKAYRVAIEGLFRQGYIRIMISTGTLALGINAPARTTVFCGDSPYLTALMYRQCAGRAGRRGFDLLGNVVFFGLPYSRVQRLALSSLPALGDNFPMTCTLILRLFSLLGGSQESDFAVQSIQNILKLPRISHRTETGREQVLHHVRFSIEYLRHSKLLDKEGNPANLFGLASHLYYTEPSNFALVHLFESNVIHQICSSQSDEAETQLLVLLCHLFGRKLLPANYIQPQLLDRLREKFPSRIILPPLPRWIGEKLQEHDEDIVRMFSSYALSYARNYRESLGEDLSLPISNQQFPSYGLQIEAVPFVQHLKATKLTPIARSIFASTSGLSDDFTSVSSLVHTVRKGIHLHEHAIPSMASFTAHADLPGQAPPEHRLNAYIYDFYQHGQLSTLALANGIRRGDIWYLLQDFELVLKTIKSSLQELLIQLSVARTGQEVVLDDGHRKSESEEPSDEDVEKEGDDDKAGMSFKRPPKTKNEDWKVYELVSLISTKFEEKFRAIWA